MNEVMTEEMRETTEMIGEIIEKTIGEMIEEMIGEMIEEDDTKGRWIQILLDQLLDKRTSNIKIHIYDSLISCILALDLVLFF